MSVSQNSLAEGQSAEQHSFAFRISLAASIGFTLGQLLGWDFPFLPSLLAVQLLAARRFLDLKHALGFVALMAVGCIFSLLIALIFIDRPLDFALVIALIVFLEFLALARGKSAADYASADEPNRPSPGDSVKECRPVSRPPPSGL